MPSDIEGLDQVLNGGFIEQTVNLICGEPGTGKTILSHQLIFNQIQKGKKILYFSTISEPTIKMIHFLSKFSFYIDEVFNSELVYRDLGDAIIKGDLLNAINIIFEHIDEIEPDIVVFDSFKALEMISQDINLRHKFIYELSIKLSSWGITSFFAGEYTQQDQSSPIFAIADTIIFLLREKYNLTYYRYINVTKKRGSNFREGLHPFLISTDGITIYPRLRIRSKFEIVPDERLSFGLDRLDEMLEGGIIRNTTTLIAGSTGTGKTILSLHFLVNGAHNDEPGTLITYQENMNQIIAMTKSFGWELEKLIEEKKIMIEYIPPVDAHLEINGSIILDKLDNLHARRVAIDTINDIELIAGDMSNYREHLYTLTNNMKSRGITTILTTEISEIFGNFKLSDEGVSFITDNVILLKYVELLGEMGRSIHILKNRGSNHNKGIYLFSIGNTGIRIEEKINVITGILTGNPVVTDDMIKGSVKEKKKES